MDGGKGPERKQTNSIPLFCPKYDIEKLKYSGLWLLGDGEYEEEAERNY